MITIKRYKELCKEMGLKPKDIKKSKTKPGYYVVDGKISPYDPGQILRFQEEERRKSKYMFKNVYRPKLLKAKAKRKRK